MLSMSEAGNRERSRGGQGRVDRGAQPGTRLACPGFDSRFSAAPSLVSAVHLQRWLDPNTRNVPHIVDKVEQLCGSSCRRGRNCMLGLGRSS